MEEELSIEEIKEILKENKEVNILINLEGKEDE